MDSADQTPQVLVHADGYSYTEIIQAPSPPGTPGGTRLTSVFHAFFTPEIDNVPFRNESVARPHTQTRIAPSDIA